MGVVLEIIAIVAAVAIVGIVIGISVWRKATGRKGGCGCGKDCSCCGGSCGTHGKKPRTRNKNKA